MDSFARRLREPVKFRDEPGFVSFDLFDDPAQMPPDKTAGILAFLQVDEYSEMVLSIQLLDDLAVGYATGRIFYEHANFASYYPFSCAENNRDVELARLRLYARLTEKYRAPQEAWTVDDYSTGPLVREHYRA